MSDTPNWHGDYKLPRRLTDIQNLIENIVDAEAEIEKLKALLRESKCPKAAQDYISMGEKCIDGVLHGSRPEPHQTPCPHCSAVEEVLNVSN